MMADREAAQAERAAMVERLSAQMPLSMRGRAQWLLWKLERREGEAKPRKVPYYASGKRRTGTQGDEADRAALVAFDVALDRLRRGMVFAGVGFAFLPGDGLLGIDIDGAIDAETGEVSELCTKVIELAGSYTEFSPSRRGVHIICAGETKTAKDNGIGLEMFCSSQYFTCTGEWWPGAPREVRAIAADALAWLHETIALAKEEAKRAKASSSSPAQAPVPSPPASPPPAPTPAAGHGGDDFKRVNDGALRALSLWVPELLPAAKPNASTGGYRVTSKDLGRDLQEDLSITPDGIMDFGLERGFTPIDLVMQWSASLKTPSAALHWLAERINLALGRKPPLRLVGASSEQLGMDERPEPPPEGEAGPAAPPFPSDRGAGRRPRKPPSLDERGRGVVDRLLVHFALLYGTDTVWDGEQRAVMQVKNLRLLFGGPLVNAWLAHPMRRLLYPEQLVFEPGVELPEGHVNLFDGFALEPIECTEADVKPMLDLGRHLCSLSAPTQAEADRIWQQVLCWLALPIQRPGAKLRFALVFHGPQGTGKNLFFDTVRAVYGKYGRMVGQTELEDRFNGYMSGKLLLIGNEVVTRQELFHNKNKLKWVITEDQIPIRGMHQEVRWESNHANLVFLSNELQPVALEKDDRRHLVVYTPAANDEDLYLRVADFIRNHGAAKFMHYLLRYVDTEGFTEFTKPLMTQAKEALIELGLKPAERFANEWLEGLLPLPLQVCSAEQLYRVFRRWSELNGERFVPPQAQFTKQVERHVFERVEIDADGERLPPRLAYKVIKLKHESGARKSVRCWLPAGTGPLNGVTEGEWAAACVEAFEASTYRFGRAALAEDDEQ